MRATWTRHKSLTYFGLWRFDTRSIYYFYTRAYENTWLTRLPRMREVRGLERFDASLQAIGRFVPNLNVFIKKIKQDYGLKFWQLID